MNAERSSKRARIDDPGEHPMPKHPDEDVSLQDLVRRREWDAVTALCRAHPDRVVTAPDPSPLAVACRCGAPYRAVQALLAADPSKLRHVLDARGTPLHEAIVCPHGDNNNNGSLCRVIDALLKADEALGRSDPTRATLLQDVDGYTPLHLLIRRRFQEHILRSDNSASLMEILEMLVRSCPEAVVIPDRGEYEEPPIVYALKANIYAPSLGSTDDTLARVERQIYEMVRTMLKHAPNAAAQVFSGFRGQYSALHSAVFHGRYTTTIDLLLQTEEEHPAAQKAALLTNTQSELPLHFCAMRGERPLTVALLSKAAPEAVQKRDASGLSPFHWLWIRFVSTMCAIDGDRGGVGGGGDNNSITLRNNLQLPYLINHYNDFTAIEQGNFEADLRLIRRLDPPVDFLRMRHIPPEIAEDATSLRWAQRSIQVLERVRDRFRNQEEGAEQTWTRQEAVVGLFWTKVVSLLQASSTLGPNMPSGEDTLVHTAFVCPSCPPPVARLTATLFPQELRTVDDRGRLPIHYAASRTWHAWDWSRRDGVNGGQAAARFLRGETLATLRVAVDMSPRGALRVADRDNRLVLHLAVEAFVKSCFHAAPRATEESTMKEMLKMLHDLVVLNPESLHRRDGVTKLYPFLQATAVATEQQAQRVYGQNDLPLSMTYALLRENPLVLKK